MGLAPLAMAAGRALSAAKGQCGNRHTPLRDCFSTSGGLSYTGLANDCEVKDYYVEIEGIPISGTTYEVNCNILPGVKVELFNGAISLNITNIDGSGNYTV